MRRFGSAGGLARGEQAGERGRAVADTLTSPAPAGADVREMTGEQREARAAELGAALFTADGRIRRSLGLREAFGLLDEVNVLRAAAGMGPASLAGRLREGR